MNPMKDFYEYGNFSSTTVDCSFKHRCTSANSFKCNSCRHNRGKKDYYDPMPYRPYIPDTDPWNPNPFVPFKPIYITCQRLSSNKTTPRFAD